MKRYGNFFLWIVFGGLVGWVASMIMGTNGQQGIILNVIIGIIGAVIGTWIMSFFMGQEDMNGFSLYGFMIALMGASVFIILVKMVRRVF